MLKLVRPDEETESLLERLQVVVIDCPVDTFADSRTQKLFGKYIALKLNGYTNNYEQGIIPVGAFDFVGTIVMICEKRGDDLEPVTCFKSSSLGRARNFSLHFEALSLFPTDAEREHREYIERLIERMDQEHKTLGYISSWTMDSEWGRGTHLRKFFLNLSLSTLINYHADCRFNEIIAYAVLRFKIDEVLSFVGFELGADQGRVLGPIDTWFVKNEKTAMMHFKRFAEDAIVLGNTYRPLWEKRITIDLANSLQKKKAA